MSAPVAPQHVCQLYAHDDALLRTMATFLEPGLTRPGAVIAIATPAHLDELAQRLGSAHDVAAARRRGRFVALDAAEALEGFMVGGMPDRGRFVQTVGLPVVETLRRYGSVRAFGEMVSLLWQRNEHAAAIALEGLWNELIGFHPVALLCGYDASGSIGELAEVVATHAGVVSAA